MTATTHESTSPPPSAPKASTPDAAERRRAVLSSFLGSTVEYYDFLLYAAAAGLVFPKLFFGSLSPAMGTTLSFVILLIGYISRPIGSMAFGHFGDKYGRKNVLVITLLTMGIVSVAIGLMPSADIIGVAAPILLVVLRTVQGVAVGGEWAGATLMAMEHYHRWACCGRLRFLEHRLGRRQRGLAQRKDCKQHRANCDHAPILENLHTHVHELIAGYAGIRGRNW